MVKPGAIVIEGHTQGLSNTRALGEAGVPVFVVDITNCIARYSKYCLKFFRCPGFAGDDFAHFLIALARREGIKDWLLLPSNDHAVYTLARNKNRLEQYYRLAVPSLAVVDNLYDKAKLLAVARRINLPCPVTRYFKTPQDALEAQPGFPLITKGRRGLSFYKTFGRKVFLAETEAALREQLAFIEKHYDIGDTFTQELIPFDGSNRTVSFTSFCIGGEIKAHWTGIKLREHPWRFGTATLAESTVIPECRQHAERLLRALDYSGVCEVEFLYDPRSREYKLIEVNARTWLWVGLARACGVDYALMLYHYVNGHEMVYPQDYRQGLKWINRLTDTFISLRAILQGQLKISEYIQSLRGPKVSAIFSWRDPWPSVMFPFLALLLARKRKFLN